MLFRGLAKIGVIKRLAALQRRRDGAATVPSEFDAQLDWAVSLSDPTRFYRICVVRFDQELDPEIMAHRTFFSENQRGFGEDAFHVMWDLLIQKYRPKNFLEIGVYRGQVLSLVSLLQRLYGIDAGQCVGIGPFERVGDQASVVNYGHCDDWLADTLANCDQFDLPQPELVKALSTDAVAADRIQSQPWDMIYIDGNHDYEVVQADWNLCAAAVSIGGVIVLDDAGLDTNYRPPLYASGGFPGPSKVAEAQRTEEAFREILQVGHNRAFERIA